MRRLFSRWDAVGILAVLAVAGALFLRTLSAPKGAVAVVEWGDRVLLRQELSALSGETEYRFAGEEGRRVTVVLSPQGARISAAECPDQVCVGTGELTRAGEAAVCLPSRISLRLEGAGGPDAVTF